jgi:predicted nucleic acid-binding protein
MNQSPQFDTAQIGPLREILKRFSALKSSIEDFVQFRVIVDANYVVQTLIYQVRYPDRGPTAIEELVKATVMDVFAPRWLDSEMKSAIRKAAIKSQLSETALWARWIAFRQLLKWDDTLGKPGPTVDCCDPKDMPYVTLQHKISADGILSKDAHIRSLGGHPLTLDFVLTARSYARAAVTSVSIRVFGTLLPTVSIMAIAEMLKGAGRAITRIPKPLQMLLLVGAVVALLHPTSRAWIQDRLAKLGAVLSPLWDSIVELTMSLAKTHTESYLLAQLHLENAKKEIRARANSCAAQPRVRRRRRSRPTTGSGIPLRTVVAGQ